MDRAAKNYTQPYSTPYYEELKRKGISLPCCLTHSRTDAARIEKPKDARMFRMMFLTPRADGCCGTIDTSSQTNLIMTKQNMKTELTYRPNPTKEDLLEYFGKRIAVRKMTPKEALRLMDVDDGDIDKMLNAEETVVLKSGKIKTKKAISKTAAYRLAGNSIVVNVLTCILGNLFIHSQDNSEKDTIQLTLF